MRTTRSGSRAGQGERGRLEEREQARVHADGEHEHGNRRQRMDRLPRERPDAVAGVLDHALEPWRAPDPARLLAHQRHVAKRAPGGGAGLAGRHAGRIELLALHRLMNAQLLLKVGIEMPVPNPGAQVAEQTQHQDPPKPSRGRAG
jgi:hypothetical protein